MAGRGWVGEEEFNRVLTDLNGHHPPPASKIKNVVSTALKYPNEFKMIVYDLEKWMKKSPIPDRIAGIYAMDSICRGNRAIHKDKSKDQFSNRFATRLNEIFMLLNGASEADLNSLSRVVEEWMKWDIFPTDKLIAAVKGIRSGNVKIPSTRASETSSTSTSTMPLMTSSMLSTTNSITGVVAHEAPVAPVTDPRLRMRSGDNSQKPSSSSATTAMTTPTTATVTATSTMQPSSSSSLSSSTADSTKQKVLSSENNSLSAEESSTSKQTNKESLTEIIGKRKNIKYCPFRDGNCPYGDKCRFTHGEGKVYFPTSRKKQRRTYTEYRSPETLLDDAWAMQHFSASELVKYYQSKNRHIIPTQLPRFELPKNVYILEFDGSRDISSSNIRLTSTDEEIYRNLLY